MKPVSFSIPDDMVVMQCACGVCLRWERALNDACPSCGSPEVSIYGARPHLPDAYKHRRKIGHMAVRDLELSVRASNGLTNAGVVTLDDLTRWTRTDLKQLYNMGRKSIDEIEYALQRLGMHLGMGDDR